MRRGAIMLVTTFVLAGAAKAGSTRCWIDRGAVVAAAAFGDIAGDFIIDIGAPVSQLHVTRANQDGIETDAAVRNLVLAKHRVAHARLTVGDLDSLPQTDTSIAGIIGADILARYPVNIAFAPCRLTWGPGSRERGAVSLPLIDKAGPPVIEVTLSDGARSRRQAMIVSTGRPEMQVAHAELSHAPIANSTALVRLRAVDVNGILLEQVPAAVADTGPDSIGTGVWRHWRALRMDWKRRRLDLFDQSP